MHSSILNINKQLIKTTYHNDYYSDSVFTLLKDGTLYRDTEIVDTNIKEIWDCLQLLFTISNNNIIKCIGVADYAKETNPVIEFINNNDYQYKKIVHIDSELVALTYDNKLRIVVESNLLNGIDPENLVNVEDVFVKEIEGFSATYIKQNNEIKTLFILPYEPKE